MFEPEQNDQQNLRQEPILLQPCENSDYSIYVTAESEIAVMRQRLLDSVN
jgi:hypothetical protein